MSCACCPSETRPKAYRASSFESRMSRRTVQSSERILHSHSLHSIITNVSVCSVFLARYRSEGFSSSWRPTCVVAGRVVLGGLSGVEPLCGWRDFLG